MSRGSKKKGKRQRLLTAAIIVLLVICAFSVYKVVSIYAEYKKARDENRKIADAAVSTAEPGSGEADTESARLQVDYAALEEMNNDYIGWLDIPDTDISYPVVYASDYEEYIHTSFQGDYLYAGTLFADYRCREDWSGKNTIIYGHRMNDGSMFGTLKKYFDRNFFENHREIDIYIQGKVMVYEVFSVYEAIAADESYTVDFADDEAFQSWLNSLTEKNTLANDTALCADDKVIMLSTCRGGENDYRTVVFAVLKNIIEQ